MRVLTSSVIHFNSVTFFLFVYVNFILYEFIRIDKSWNSRKRLPNLKGNTYTTKNFLGKDKWRGVIQVRLCRTVDFCIYRLNKKHTPSQNTIIHNEDISLVPVN